MKLNTLLSKGKVTLVQLIGSLMYTFLGYRISWAKLYASLVGESVEQDPKQKQLSLNLKNKGAAIHPFHISMQFGI